MKKLILILSILMFTINVNAQEWFNKDGTIKVENDNVILLKTTKSNEKKTMLYLYENNEYGLLNIVPSQTLKNSKI